MSRQPQLTSWQQHLASRFPSLPTPVLFVLALYSFGVILAHASGLSCVVLFLAAHLGHSPDALRKRLSEFYKEASAKSGVKQGQKRRDLDVTPCFAPLLRWILSLWSGQHLALAIDVTNLGDRFHVLCVSVVVRGVGIPVAWKVLLGGVKDPWNPHWKTLLTGLQKAVPADWTVIVPSDRGLESADLFRVIAKLGWHPLMRVKKGGKFRPKGWSRFHLLGDLVGQVGESFASEGWAYSGEKLPCTLLARWEAGHEEPWLLLTTLPPEAGNAVWYALRSWIEQGFKIIKGGGWDWQYTRMEDPGRVERLWLVLAVATLWVVALGADDEVQEENRAFQEKLSRQLRETEQQAQQREQRERVRRDKQAQALEELRRKRQERWEASRKTSSKKATASKKAADKNSSAAGQCSASQERTYRVSRRGLAVWQAERERGVLPLPKHLHPQDWPPPAHTASSLTEQEFLSQQT